MRSQLRAFLFMKKVLIIGWSGALGSALLNAFKNDFVVVAGRTAPLKGDYVYLDLSLADCIFTAVNKLSTYSFDLIFVNSGMYDKEKNYEHHMMVNAIGPYILIKELCKRIPSTKIIVTSSVSILHAKQDLSPVKKRYYYRNSKLLEWLLFEKLKKDYPMHTIVYAHPGITYSNISKKLHPWTALGIRLFAKRPNTAIEPLLLAGEKIASDGGWYAPAHFFSLFGPPVFKKMKLSNQMNPDIYLKIKNKIKQLEEEMGFKAMDYSVTIVAYEKEQMKRGMCCAWAMQVDYDKLVCMLGSQSDTGKALQKGDIVGVSVLSKEQKSIAIHFGEHHSDSFDKFDSIKIEQNQGAILIPQATRQLVCRVIDVLHLEKIEEDNLLYLEIIDSQEYGDSFLHYSEF